MMTVTASPDENARGLLQSAPDPLRYDNHPDDPAEVAGIIKAAMPSGVRVLDVGCGTGSVTLIANSGKNNDVVCLEPDADRAEAARSRGLTVFTQTLDEAFIAEHGPFDVIMFSDVLEHLPAPADVLQLAIRGLKPGGLIVASVPNVAHWTVRANLLIGRFDYQDTGIYDSTHLRWFTAKSFKALFRNNGLEVLSIKQTAGVDLGVYHSIFPFRYIRPTLKKPAIRLLTRLFPHLVGCQHVVVARKGHGFI